MAYHVKKTSEHSRRDPSQGGWDTTIVKAPDSHSSSKHVKKHRHHRKRKKLSKAVVGVLIALLVVVGLGAGAAFAYMKSLNHTMSLGDGESEIVSSLTDTPVTKPFYALVLGSDLRGATDDAELFDASSDMNGTGFSDVIILLRVDAANSKITMLSIPRDTPIYFDSTWAKLNWAYHYGGGAPALISKVEEITGVKISHYAEVSGENLENLVDNLGGITANVQQGFTYTTFTGDQVTLEEGTQHLNGAQALALANMRTQYGGDQPQDYNRQIGARQVMIGIIKAIMDRPAVEIPGAVSDAASCVRTDMNVNDIVDIARMMDSSPTVYTGTGPYVGARNPYSSPTHSTSDAPWLCYVNDAGWKRVMDIVEAGEDPSGISYANDTVHFAGQPEETWSQGPVDPE